jgi:hypothetical protein
MVNRNREVPYIERILYAHNSGESIKVKKKKTLSSQIFWEKKTINDFQSLPKTP